MSISPNVNRNSKQETLGIDSDCENKIERNKKLEIKRSKYVNKEQLWTMEWHGLCLILLVCYGATLSCLFRIDVENEGSGLEVSMSSFL